MSQNWDYHIPKTGPSSPKIGTTISQNWERHVSKLGKKRLTFVWDFCHTEIGKSNDELELMWAWM